MATTTTTTNKPLNPRAQDLSPKGYNRANIFSGKALDFDGVNDIITGSSAALPASDYTIAAWFNLDTLKASGIVVWGDEAAFERRALFVWNGGSGPYYLYSSTYSSNIAATTQLSAGRWYFGVVTLTSAGAAKIYLNGREDGSGTNTLAAYTGTQYKVGDTLSSEFTDGKIAGVRVFNQVLTPAQVSDLYLNPEKIVPDGVASSALKLWLPMMEGAGASAYDGSGNGNDGTINGATWTAGIGAPVAQTALVSWNKGVNLVRNSEVFTSIWNVANAGTGSAAPIITANYGTAPNGTQTATRLQLNRGADANSYSQVYQYPISVTAGQVYAFSVYVKSLSGTPTISIIGDGGRPPKTITNEWALYSGTYTAPSNITQCEVAILGSTYASGNSQTADILVWGYSLRPASAGDAYIKTNATAQTSAVLVPEGLTAGASIFGTDIITPRNAFALNLDGASYAGVKDNASIDITSAASMEFWVNATTDNVPQFIGKRLSSDSNWLRLYGNAGTIYFEGNSGVSINTSIPTSTWTHFVGTINGTSATLYKNGVSVATGSITFSMSNAAPVGIGAWLDSLTQVAVSTTYVNGQLANPRIYNRALTAAEVLRNYNADKAKFGL